jgi:glc operon protein GlcG
MKTKLALTIDDAKRAAAAAIAKADANQWQIVLAIVDDGANLLYFERMDGAKLGSVKTAVEKARTAVLFGRPTKALEDIVGGGRNAMLKLPDATPIQGGLPIVHQGQVVGGIGISGVQSAQDEEIARAGCDVLE